MAKSGSFYRNYTKHTVDLKCARTADKLLSLRVYYTLCMNECSVMVAWWYSQEPFKCSDVVSVPLYTYSRAICIQNAVLSKLGQWVSFLVFIQNAFIES